MHLHRTGYRTSGTECQQAPLSHSRTDPGGSPRGGAAAQPSARRSAGAWSCSAPRRDAEPSLRGGGRQARGTKHGDRACG